MEVECRLELNFESESMAKMVLKTVAVDNEDFVRAWRDGRSIISVMSADSFLSLLHTVEDYLACVSVAERTIKSADNPPGRERQRPSRKKASRHGS